MIKFLIKIFNRPKYVITMMNSGVKYYYLGSDSRWTPLLDGAKVYKKKPTFNWISEYFHKIEEV